jgi:hypothetical protein
VDDAHELAQIHMGAMSGSFEKQIAIAPMLPNHPQHFGDLAAEASDRTIVETYFDGAGGRRSRALGIGELYKRLGYTDWFNLARRVHCSSRCARGWATITCSSAATASTRFNVSARRQECRRLRDPISGIDVQEKILTTQPADSCALGRPLRCARALAHRLCRASRLW